MNRQDQVERGESAKRLLDGLSGLFERRQVEYLSELKAATRSGGDIGTPAMALRVLDDIVEDLVSEIQTGHRAARKLEEVK